MDRLLCGDVGFGKTEVAARALFKCVADGKQAAVLVPTTLLANQHYYTSEGPVRGISRSRSRCLSRFRSAAQQKHIAEELKKGRIDLVIGTHRLLSEDMEFKDLGLLVIDEEQRFGVKHKEKLKQLKDQRGCPDSFGHTDTQDAPYVPVRRQGYEHYRRTAGGQVSSSDICDGAG